MQNELLKIIESASKNLKVISNEDNNANNKIHGIPSINVETREKSALLDLLKVIFERFQQVITSHSVALCGFSRVTKKYNLEVTLYGITDVWNNIQAVVSTYCTQL